MKAVILAAGQGSRLRSVTGKRCKCLLSFGGRTILDHQLDAVFETDITDVGIVVGYGKEQIIDHVGRQHPEKLDHIAFITNEDFAFSNNMYSLWRAKTWLREAPFVCLNADVLFHRGILSSAAQTTPDISVVIDREFRDETTKVILRHDRVVELSKSIGRKRFDATFVGIASFSSEGARLLFRSAERMFASGQTNQFFNDVLHGLAVAGMPIGFTWTGDLPWAEVDDADDVLFAQTHIMPQMSMLQQAS